MALRPEFEALEGGAPAYLDEVPALGSDFFVATELRPAAAGPLRNVASLDMAVLERRISDNPKVVRLRDFRTVAPLARNT